MPVQMRDRAGRVHVCEVRGRASGNNGLVSYHLLEPSLGRGRAADPDRFMKQFKLGAGDAVGICTDDEGRWVLDCDSAEFPSPQIRAVLAEIDSRGANLDDLTEIAPSDVHGDRSTSRFVFHHIDVSI